MTPRFALVTERYSQSSTAGNRIGVSVGPASEVNAMYPSVHVGTKPALLGGPNRDIVVDVERN
jgi:hypothetical protein